MFLVLHPSGGALPPNDGLPQHLPADGHGAREWRVLRVRAADVRGRGVRADAVLLRADLHVAELRDAARGQGRGVRGPQNIRVGRHKLCVHRAGDILWLHRAARLPADRRHQVQDPARVLLPDQLVRQPVSVHHTHGQLQARGLLHRHQVSGCAPTVAGDLMGGDGWIVPRLGDFRPTDFVPYISVPCVDYASKRKNESSRIK